MDDDVAVTFLDIIDWSTFLFPIEPRRVDDDELTDDAFDPVI